MSKRPIYLDYNATTPIDSEVAKVMRPFLDEHFGNPSSAHSFGKIARDAVALAREQVAALIGASPGEIVFTSGGSESNNMALKGFVGRQRPRRCRILTSAVEHPAILEPCLALDEIGHRVEILPVDGLGRLDPQEVETRLFASAAVSSVSASSSSLPADLVSVMHANNEVGTLQPVREIADLAHAHGAVVHTDAAQSVGKIPVLVDELGVDLLSIAGHKLYAPKGVGALYIRSGLQLEPLIHGAGHESGLRAGTENVLLVVGLGKAAELARKRLDQTTEHCTRMRDRLWNRLNQSIPGLEWNGDRQACLPNTLSVAIPGVIASDLIAAIAPRLAASAGSACHADGAAISTVLWAMAFSTERAVSTIRLSVGRETTPDEVDAATDIIIGHL